MKNHITTAAEAYVKDLLGTGLTADHRYHSLTHTLSVRDAGLALGRRYQLSPEELEELELAALFHDTGFVKTYDGHETASQEIAEQYLTENQYPPERIEQVKKLIEVTQVERTPETLQEKVMKDADFNTLERNYLDKAEDLRHEWKVFKNIEMGDDEWAANNYVFWKAHQFYTGEGKAMFGDQRRKFLKKLRKKMEKSAKKNGKKETIKDDLEFAINSSKSAQMMFKTTLRNQIDLTNIADNKANIMLTINSALITVGMPLLATRLERQPELLYPAATLLLTCILTIVFATLATRPAKMLGHTDLTSIDQGNTNLFFFGNFFRMKPNEYRAGLKKVVQNHDLLDKTIVNDLYFLGISLGRKYTRLHTTYSIFMYGMIITVTVYVISTMLTRGGGAG